MNCKILIVDDHKIFSESLKAVLESNQFYAKCITDASLAVNYCISEEFDVLITDIEMPIMTGIELIKRMKSKEPILTKVPKYIVLTSHTKTKTFKQLYNLGIDAYLSKNISPVELLSAIKKVRNDEKYFEKTIYDAFLHSNKTIGVVEFTPRELDVLKLILEEKTTNEIADELNISIFTVEGHRKNLMQKTNSKNVVGLIKYALLNNM